MKNKQNTVAIAIFYREDFKTIASLILPRLIKIIPENLLPLINDKPLTKIPYNELTLRDLDEFNNKPIIFQNKNESPDIVINALDPQIVNTPHPQKITLARPEKLFNYDAFITFIQNNPPLYAFATLENTTEDALDEINWPLKPASPQPENRAHTNAWLRIIRAFAKSDIGKAIPDIYWLNILGPKIINEIRKINAWADIEKSEMTQSIDKDFIIIKAATHPIHYNELKNIDEMVFIADLLSPIFIIQKALQQARQGNNLILDDLVETKDQRLLLGLASASGLEAFKKLLNTPEAQNIESVADAIHYIEKTKHLRPRCYGETWEQNAPETIELPNIEKVHTEELNKNKYEKNTHTHTQSLNWYIRTISRTGLRIELATLQWQLDLTKPGPTLELGLINTLPKNITFGPLTATRISDEKPTLIINPAPDHTLALPPGEKTHFLSLDMPAPENNDRLILSAPLAYRLNEPVADLVWNENSLKILGATSVNTMMISTWPAAANFTTIEDRIYIQITNTTQETWKSWSLKLITAGKPENIFDEYIPQTTLNSAESAYATFDASKATTEKALQILLTAEISTNCILADFQATN